MSLNVEQLCTCLTTAASALQTMDGDTVLTEAKRLTDMLSPTKMGPNPIWFKHIVATLKTIIVAPYVDPFEGETNDEKAINCWDTIHRL
jgi:hypothetical protein